MQNDFVYGFLDESPSLSDDAFFFCVDILSTSEKINKRLQKIIKNARKKIVKKKLKQLSELKFYNSDEKTRVFVLSELAKINVEIVVFILDKEKRRIADTPENYGIVVGAAVSEFLTLHSSISLTIDKKFVNPKKQKDFFESCQKTINKLISKGKNVFFNPPVDSAKDSNVQLADFVAGAFNAKFNKNNDSYFKLIQRNVKKEKVVKWTEVKKRIMNPKF